MQQVHPKISAGALAGAFTALVMAELGRRGVTIAPEEGAALTAILSFLVGYFVPSDASSGAATAASPAPAPAPVAPVAPPATPAAS